ncbi:tyrosine--tRNA ligase [Helicovermis profundi]|uniref:Tyrosine--tRNA ligase n=1 Tax=Helicovermis profundi TaxID=3065157 RepID=A0AAU9E3R9_9FIRM|nr:tyrosine--tRNA ligase [Clostridia bacterium S502]
MRNVFDVLSERGFIEQITHEDEVKELFQNERVNFYIGFDPTADSLHVGHFIQVMVMMHMQKAGHRPIALVGGGTAKVGDPTGKTDMRKMLTPEKIKENGHKIGKQLEKYLNLNNEDGFIANNATWLDNLNYIEFLREIGSRFSVNRMLAAECFKQRLEKGLSFLEFNYMIMQGYDFLELNRRYNCKMQLGGNDQWSNIIAGVELIRKKDQKQVYGLTFKLLTTSEGKKMGKTEKGALWIDPEKTSPYEFFQYFRNVEDADVINCTKLLTFIPMEEIREMEKLEGADLNPIKERMAFEVTKIVHGEEEARKSLEAAKALFAGNGDESSMPKVEIAKEEFNEGMPLLDLLLKADLIASKGEGKRLIKQNGISLDGEKVKDFAINITREDFKGDSLKIRKGKKVFKKIILI